MEKESKFTQTLEFLHNIKDDMTTCFVVTLIAFMIFSLGRAMYLDNMVSVEVCKSKTTTYQEYNSCIRGDIK
jgi:hypothetical protein